MASRRQAHLSGGLRSNGIIRTPRPSIDGFPTLAQKVSRLANSSTAPPERKTAAWWDEFWQRPLAATGRALTCRRTAEEALRLLRPALSSLAPGRQLRVLDLGSGHGDLTLHLLRDARLRIVALDLSAAALAQFGARLSTAGAGVLAGRLSRVRASAYELPFADGSFDAVVSFGYASAASYDGVEYEVARVLKPGGIAVVDFVSPSFYRWVAAPCATARWLRRYRDSSQAQYHFGRLGLARHFGPAGLSLDRVAYVNAYPPLERIASQPWSAALDRRLSALAGPVLGRVLLARLVRQ
jgi:ubiquinone/menaquinone biosynthesis C-methylase UbiE